MLVQFKQFYPLDLMSKPPAIDKSIGRIDQGDRNAWFSLWVMKIGYLYSPVHGCLFLSKKDFTTSIITLPALRDYKFWEGLRTLSLFSLSLADTWCNNTVLYLTWMCLACRKIKILLDVPINNLLSTDDWIMMLNVEKL